MKRQVSPLGQTFAINALRFQKGITKIAEVKRKN